MFTSRAEDRFTFYSNDSLQRRLEQAAPAVLSVKVGCAVFITVGIGGFNSGTHATVGDIITFVDSSRIARIELSCEGRNLTLRPYTFSIRAADTTVLAQRLQYLIIAAYAVTVHRCQGMNLAKVAMNFDRVDDWKPFGMVYVALSWYKSLKGLWVKSLTDEHILVNPDSSKLMERIELLREHYPNRVISSVSAVRRRTVDPLREITLNNLALQFRKRKRIATAALVTSSTSP